MAIYSKTPSLFLNFFFLKVIPKSPESYSQKFWEVPAHGKNTDKNNSSPPGKSLRAKSQPARLFAEHSNSFRKKFFFGIRSFLGSGPTLIRNFNGNPI